MAEADNATFIPLEGFFLDISEEELSEEFSSIDLTVIIDVQDRDDALGGEYRGLLKTLAQLRMNLNIIETSGLTTVSDIRAVLRKVSTEYVVFIRAGHRISRYFFEHLAHVLQMPGKMLVEPVFYPTRIPRAYSRPHPMRHAEVNMAESYLFDRETDIYGPVFHAQMLDWMLDATAEIDRASVYLNYRIFWRIDEVEIIEAAYSYGTTRRIIKGIELHPDVEQLYLNHVSAPETLRPALTKNLVLVLRYLRGVGQTRLIANDVRESVDTHKMGELATRLTQRDAFESRLVQSLATTNEKASGDPVLFKETKETEILLSFGSQPVEDIYQPATDLYRLKFSDEELVIRKHYVPRERNALGIDRDSTFSFYDFPITPDSLILVFDRPTAADDNAEHFYRFMMQEHPEFKRVRFALQPYSPDWPRLEAEGFNLVPIFSEEFYQNFVDSDLVVSSQVYLPEKGGKNFSNSRFLYLQHGIQLNDMKEWSSNKAFDVFVTTGVPETEYMQTIAATETFNVGLPRLATLERKSDGKTGDITFMPTWRFALDHLTKPQFGQSDFARRINDLLSDQRLQTYLEATGRDLQVKLHPNLEKFSDQFIFEGRVKHTTDSYRDLIEYSDFILTDYSSVVCDAAFIGIPVAYYQWDSDHFFDMQAYSSRLDYRTDGLGPVFDTKDEVIRFIVDQQFDQTANQYRDRVARFFEGVEQDQILPRLFEKMMQL